MSLSDEEKRCGSDPMEEGPEGELVGDDEEFLDDEYYYEEVEDDEDELEVSFPLIDIRGSI